MKINKRKFIRILKKLIHYPSVTGQDCSVFNDNIISYICDFFKKLDIDSQIYNRNGILLRIPGIQQKGTPNILFSAHYDIIGAMVSRIDENGVIRLVKVGSYPFVSIVGSRCEIFSRKGMSFSGRVLPDKWSTHIYSDRDIEKQDFTEDTLLVRLDERITSKKEVEDLGIELGNFIFFEPDFYTSKSGYISSRYLDDKACVAVLMSVVQKFSENDFKENIPFSIFLSAHEETGFGASLDFNDRYDEFIAVDIGITGPGQQSLEDHVTICVKDSCFPYDEKLINRLSEVAGKNRIQYKYDIFRSYGSDASALISTGHDIRIALVGPGIDASHSFERTHFDGIKNTARLIWHYVRR